MRLKEDIYDDEKPRELLAKKGELVYPVIISHDYLFVQSETGKTFTVKNDQIERDPEEVIKFN